MGPFGLTERQFFIVWIAVAVGITGFMALLRRSAGLPFFQPKLANVELRQNWISGGSSVGLMGSLGWANNCLWFALTDDTLYVGAHFPFNMFMPRIFMQLDLAIPVATITSVSEKTGSLRGDWVRVEYQAASTARTEYVDLRVRRDDRFLEILQEKAARARAPRPFSR